MSVANSKGGRVPVVFGEFCAAVIKDVVCTAEAEAGTLAIANVWFAP